MRGRHLGIEIILTNEEERQFPDGCQVERFKKNTLIHRALAKIGKRDAVLILQLSSERRACRVWNPSTYDGICAQQPHGWIGEMHRAAFTF